MVLLLSEQADDARLLLSARTLRAIAPLNAETRAVILRGIDGRFGVEVAGLLGRELDAMVEVLRNSG